jgi:hypothetical protein
MQRRYWNSNDCVRRELDCVLTAGEWSGDAMTGRLLVSCEPSSSYTQSSRCRIVISSSIAFTAGFGGSEATEAA